MEFNYEEIRQGLVKYFQNIEHYKLFRSKVNKKVVYLVSTKHEYNVLRISNTPIDTKTDDELNHFVEKTKISSHHQPKTLLIVVQENQEDNKEMAPGYWQITVDEKNLKAQLEPFFARINQLTLQPVQNNIFLKKPSKISEPNLDSENDSENLEDFSSERIQKEMRTFVARSSMNRLVLTWIMILLFAFIPLSGIVVCGLLKVNLFNLDGLERLFTGGTHYTATIMGHEYWRIFTFGFATPGSGFIWNILILVITAVTLFSLNKYIETVLGIWKSLLTFVLAYVLTGLFLTIMLPETISGGILPILGISLGILVGGISTDQSLQSKIVRAKLINPVIVLILIPLFTGGTTEYIQIVVGLIFGASIMAFLSSQSKNSSSRLALIIYGLLLLTMVILLFVFAFLPRWSPALDYRIVYTYTSYLQNGFLKNIAAVNAKFAKIGWTIRLEEISNGNIMIID